MNQHTALVGMGQDSKFFLILKSAVVRKEVRNGVKPRIARLIADKLLQQSVIELREFYAKLNLPDLLSEAPRSTTPLTAIIRDFWREEVSRRFTAQRKPTSSLIQNGAAAAAFRHNRASEKSRPDGTGGGGDSGDSDSDGPGDPPGPRLAVPPPHNPSTTPPTLHQGNNSRLSRKALPCRWPMESGAGSC